MHTETITYFHDQTKCQGFVAYDKQIETKRPLVLISPAFYGQNEFAREKAVELARFGYVGFAADIYGEGKLANDREEAASLMAPFFLDRSLLQGRIGAAYECASQLSKVDSTKIGAIGFCFGGLVVYELLRSGANLKGVVSFHGVFATEKGGKTAKTVPISKNARGSLLILHGHEDPMVSEEDLKRVQQEMTEAKIDWQMDIYGHTMHAFTNPSANDPSIGTVYHEKVAKRSWLTMQRFFDEVFASA